jgi:hypothetical protein
MPQVFRRGKLQKIPLLTFSSSSFYKLIGFKLISEEIFPLHAFYGVVGDGSM